MKQNSEASPPRFTLNPGTWYAMEFLSTDDGNFRRMYSPVKIMSIHPKGNGKGLFDLQFFHANYPEGVQTKLYTLRTLQRTPTYLFAERMEQSPPRMGVLLHDLTTEWLFLHSDIKEPGSSGVQVTMNRIYPDS